MILFATGNKQKLQSAQDVCRQYGIKVEQLDIEVDEIQHEDAEMVAIDKAKKSFAEAGKAIVISDDSWNYIGLNGFPGVYMHSMNLWLTPQDFLRLVKPLKNKRAILVQHLVYYDGKDMKVFKQESEAELLEEIRGESKYPSHTITSFADDNGKSIAETYDQAKDKSTRKSAVVWHNFAKWYASLNQLK